MKFRYIFIFIFLIPTMVVGNDIDIKEVIKKNDITLRSHISDEAKISQIIERINEVKNFISLDDYYQLIKPVDNLFFKEPPSFQAGAEIFIFLQTELKRLAFYADHENHWPFSKSELDTLDYLFTFDKFEACTTPFNCKKISDIPYLKSSYNAMLAIPVAYYYGYEKALELLDDVEAGFEVKPDDFFLDDLARKDWQRYKKVLIVSVFQQRLDIAQNFAPDFKDLINKYNGMKDDMIDAVDFIYENKNMIPDWQFAYTAIIARSAQMESILGNFNQIEILSKKIEKVFPEKTTDKSAALNLREIHRALFQGLLAKGNSLDEYGREYAVLRELQDKHKWLMYEYQVISETFDWFIFSSIVNDLIETNSQAEMKLELEKAKDICERTKEQFPDECNQMINIYTEAYNKLLTSKTPDDRAEINDFVLSQLTSALSHDLIDGKTNNNSVNDERSVAQKLTDLELVNAARFSYENEGEIFLTNHYGKLFINNLQEIRKEIEDPFLIENFTSKYKLIIEQISDNFFDYGDYKSAWICLQIIKENEFLDFIRRRDAAENFLTTITIKDEENDFAQKLSLLLNQINKVEIKLNQKNINENEKDILKKSLSQFHQDKKELTEKLTAYQNKISNDSQITELASYVNLDKNEVAIQYQVRKNNLLILATSNNDVKRFNIDKPQNEIRKLISKIFNDIRSKKTVNEYELTELASSIKDPLNEFIKKENPSSIKIQTHDWLSFIPFEMIFDQKELSNLKYISTVKNALFENNSNNLYIFGASKGNKEFKPLPAVRNEINTISTIAKNSQNKFTNTIYLDDEFTEDSFIKSFNNSPDYVHIASHFRIKDGKINDSEMLLGDGAVIQLDELDSKVEKFNSKLIVLSACETGTFDPLSNATANEGLSSLFHLKGAENVISTLWELDDEATSVFMSMYYYLLIEKEYEEGKALLTTKNIFRSASLSDLNNEDLESDPKVVKTFSKISKYKNPFFWSAFQLTSSN